MKKHLYASLAALIIGSAACSQLSAQAPVFSNYGLQNLTYNYRFFSDDDPLKTHSESTVHKLETACEGNTLHMLWQEGKWGTYAVWYRRSNDLGLSWEPAVEILPYNGKKYDGGMHDTDYKLMLVKEGVINLALAPGYGCLDYLRSTDGIHFEKTNVVTFNGYAGCEIAHMEVVEDKIVIAFYHYQNTWIAVSNDAGKSFSLHNPFIPQNARLHDMAFDGEHIVLYSSMAYTDYNREGVVYASYSDDFGQNFTHNLLAPGMVNAEGKTVYRSWASVEGSYDHQPQQFMTLEGNHCYAIFHARVAENDETKYVLFASSDDYGKTWGTPHRIDTEDIIAHWSGAKSTIKAKGNNVYVILPTNQPTEQHHTPHTVFHSHDCGATFEAQDAWVESTHMRGHLSDYWLTFDPNDQSGEVVYITNNDYAWIKTTDGFRTVSQANFGDGSCPDRAGFWQNLYTQLEIDHNGNRHWFITYCPNGNGRYDVSYRRDAGEPEPSDENQALFVKNRTSDRINSRVNIPASVTYQSTEAFTVEMWVNVSSTDEDIVLAYQSHDSGQSTYHGWMLRSENGQYWNGGHSARLEASICNDDNQRIDLWPGAEYWPEDSVFIHAGEWNHVALTFDSKAHKGALYINGKLQHERELEGKYKWGWNPVMLGHEAGVYGDKAGYQIDNFRIWNRSLSATELQQSMRTRNLTATNGLCVNLGFDGTLRDLSGNGNDGIAMSDVDFVEANYTAAIEAVNADPTASAPRFDLYGRSISSDAKGIILQRGEKIMIR